jgi:hypothetical protein
VAGAEPTPTAETVGSPRRIHPESYELGDCLASGCGWQARRSGGALRYREPLTTEQRAFPEGRTA